MKVALITNCTATQSVPPKVQGSHLSSGLTVLEAAEQWAGLVGQHKPEVPPYKLYRGISFHSISKATQYIAQHDIKIVSIGQGLVALDQNIVPYDASIDPGNKNSVAASVTEEKFQPAFWWAQVNEHLNNTATPIADMVEANEHDLILVSLTGRFLQLVPEDLLTAVGVPGGTDRIRIITGSINAIPNQLKPLALQYDKRLNLNTIGNRNDFNQRASLHFLNLLKEGESRGLVSAGVDEQQQAIEQALGKYGDEDKSNTSASTEAVTQILQTDKRLSDMNPDQAYSHIRARYNIHISQGKFRKIWRQHHGISLVPKVKTATAKGMETGSGSGDAAKRALSGIKLDRSVSTSSWEDEQEALSTLHEFVTLVSEEQPDAKFGASEVFSWVQQYYDELDRSLPPQLKSVNKLAHLLRNNYDEIGLESISSGSQQGGNIYQLSQEILSQGETETKEGGTSDE